VTAPPAAARPAAALPAAGADRWMPARFAYREFRHQMTVFRRTWRGGLLSRVVNPVLYLAAIGTGLGSLVDRHAHLPGGVDYLTFIAPGLLAASAMQIAMNASMYPVLGSVKWNKTYYAAAATPVTPSGIFYGFLLSTAFRLAIGCVPFLAVMAAFGAVPSPLAVFALPVAILTGLAFSAPVAAWAITQKLDQGFNVVYRLFLVPMFLFSATFYPLTQLPAWIRPVAYVTPLWHGVDACREFTLGRVDPGRMLIHLGYLTALTAAGVIVGQRTHRKRLYL
jgi:lipooligosaccharide transport system permease protein